MRVARTATAGSREIRARGREGAARWETLARRRVPGPGADEARWNVALPAGPGRLVLGSQIRLVPEADRRGWTDPLASRRGPPGPAPSTARTGVGISWQADGARLLRAAAGRDPEGAAVAQAMAGAGGWHLGAGLRAHGATGALGWGGSLGALPARAEAMGGAGGALARAAIGRDAAGLIAEVDARGEAGRATTIRGAAAVRHGPLVGLRIEGAVRGGRSRARPFEVEWSRRGAGWAARGLVAGRGTGGGASWRLVGERTAPGADTVILTLDGDEGPRPDGVRWSWRAGSAGARVGAEVELAAGRPRAGSAYAEGPAGGGSRLSARVRWAGGRRAAFDVEWTLPALRARRHSTR